MATAHGYTKYDAFIVDPDLDTRMRLKQATSSVHNFGKVHQLQGLREANQKLGTDDRCDVIFLSYRFDQAELSEFIKQAKATKNGQDAAYILVMKSKDGDSSKVAANVMVGADGFLFEPYSVDYLMEITNLAARVRLERSDAREKAALNFIVHDIINQLDVVATMKAQGFEVVTALKKLKELCTVFKTLTPDSTKYYYDIAIKLFGDAPVPKKIETKKYGGASSRVKKRMEQKATEQIVAANTTAKVDAPK